MVIRTGRELAQACKAVAASHKTLYVMGCFGAPMTEYNKQRYIGHHSYNQRSDRAAKIRAASADTFGFDCVCFIKGLLWGWEGDAAKIYGGASYGSNGVPDIGEDAMIAACKEVSDSFSTLWVGEMLYSPGHCGIYIGDGLAVEASPAWADGVQITAVGNLGTKAGYNSRIWQKHGKLAYVAYEADASVQQQLALPVLQYAMVGASVTALQLLLEGYGFPCAADGSFGPATLAALKAYQSANGLVSDGSCGPATWGKLLGV